MAKVKKKEALSLEEKLEQALVPINEQPYEVPENWCWVKFGVLSADMADGPFGSNLKTEHYTDNKEVRIIQLSNIGEEGWREENTKYTTFEHVKTISRSIVEPGNIVIAKMMPAGRSIICPDVEKMYVLSSDAVKMVPHAQVDVKYLVYCINSPMFRNQVHENTQGITRARTSIKKLKEYAFPLPPLTEQQRIVEQIESLFAKLDEAKEKVLEAISSSQYRKDVLLHKAFEGELTCRWRDKNNVVLENDYYSFDECIKKMQNGLAKRSGSTGKEFAVIRLANLSADGFITENLRKILLDEKEQENYCLNAADVVMIRVNGSKDNVARQIYVERDTEWAFCDHIIRIKYDETKVLPRFMVYFSKCQYYRNYIADNMVSSAGQNTISRKGMSNLLVPKLELEEQEEIIKILDKLWKAEDEMQMRAEQVVEQIDLLKKSILAKAFRGELGTNNPDEESAVELLKSIFGQEE